MSQSTHRSSKGKARAAEGDCAQSFASLSLSDCGDHHAPRSEPYGSSYPDVYGSCYEQAYTGGDPWTTQSSLDPMQSPSPAYGGTSGYGSSYSTAPPTSSTGGYEYRSQPSGTSNHSDYAPYETASVTSSSVPSSYGGGSVSGWSETPSQMTAASSAPSARSNRTDVNNTIHRQGPPNQLYQLPCEFHNLTGCPSVFTGDDTQGWMDHIEGHLQSQFPSRLRCWFCSEYHFDARDTAAGDLRLNFNMRMQHIRDHVVHEGYRAAQMQVDGHLVRHLYDSNLIDRSTYERIVNPTTVPRIPGSHDRHDRHSSNRTHRRRLPQVDEEVVAESSSSSRHQHRSEHQKEHSREHRSTSHKHRRRPN